MPSRASAISCSGLILALLVIFATASDQAFSKNAASEASKDLPARLAALKAATLKHMRFVPGGTFTMDDFGPIHNEEKPPYSSAIDDDVLRKVTLDSFSIGAYKVTYADFDVFTDSTGRARVAQGQLAGKYRDIPGIPAGVNWYDAQAYCQWIGKQLNLSMTLPTEAQWEYAARSGGKMNVFATDNGKVDDGRNVASFEQRQALETEHDGSMLMPIGKYPPNPSGLYDMTANGFEWASDWYSEAYDPSPAKNPAGPARGTDKVERGYENAGGDTLQETAMTFARHKKAPRPSVTEPDSDATVYGLNHNRNDTFRCAVNGPDKIAH